VVGAARRSRRGRRRLGLVFLRWGEEKRAGSKTTLFFFIGSGLLCG
jgi:hypothetical protein